MTIQTKATCAVIYCRDAYYAVHGNLTFESVAAILKCDHSNKSFSAALSSSAVYYAVHGASNFRVWTKS